jgi:hypothetical protein
MVPSAETGITFSNTIVETDSFNILTYEEFMPVIFFRNEGATFNKLKTTGIDSLKGWWNSITSGDYDRDGDIDYIIGSWD